VEGQERYSSGCEGWLPVLREYASDEAYR